MTDHAKALHIVEHTVDEGVIHPQQEKDLISAISEALEEAAQAEREACAYIADDHGGSSGLEIAYLIRSRGEKDNG